MADAAELSQTTGPTGRAARAAGACSCPRCALAGDRTRPGRRHHALRGFVAVYARGRPRADPATSGLTPPSRAHLLGTTQTGQDVLAQLAYATRGSLHDRRRSSASLATVLSALFGIVGGYLGGLVDEAFSLLSNVFLVIPGLPLVIVISASSRRRRAVPGPSRWCSPSPAGPGRRGCCAPRRSRCAPATTCAPPGSPARRPWRVIAVEILPNLLPLLASQFVFAIIAAILGEAGLSFLGLGASTRARWARCSTTPRTATRCRSAPGGGSCRRA